MLTWWFARWAPAVFIPVSAMLAGGFLWLLQGLFPVPEDVLPMMVACVILAWLAGVVVMLGLWFFARRSRARHGW